jgi:N-methylhydantoinase B/oxoprolinase/acetone carboxylase alpha subunit
LDYDRPPPLPDSGNPASFAAVWRWCGVTAFCSNRGRSRSDRSRFAAYGLAGGRPGSLSRNVFNQQILPPKTTVEVKYGDELRHELAGAGAWGPPFERDPTAVVEDVLDEKISREHARSAYGVVLGDEGIDERD